MSKFYVSGPAYTWVGRRVPSVAEPFDYTQYDFFGFTERGLTVTVRPLTEDVEVDYAGLMPGDVSLLGIDARASATYTRYNEQILRNLMASLNFINAGFGPRGAVGNLMQSEPPIQAGDASGFMAGPPLLMYSSYGFKTEFASDMIKFIRFYSAYVADPLPQTLSVRRKGPEVNWRAIPVFGSAATNDSEGTTFSPNTAPFDTFQIFAVDEQRVIDQLDNLLSTVN